MKQTIIPIILVLAGMIEGGALVVITQKAKESKELEDQRISTSIHLSTPSSTDTWGFDVDLPEEIGTISTDSNHPTVLEGYKDGKIVNIRFPTQNTSAASTILKRLYILKKTADSRGLISVQFVDYNGREKAYDYLTQHEYDSIFHAAEWWASRVNH